MPSALVIADIASDVGSGAVLTLVFPLGVTLIAFVVWWFVLRRRGLLSAPRSADQIENPVMPGRAAATPGPATPRGE
jgi:hypothetical protein